MNEKPRATFADYHAAVQRYVGAIDKVLATGRAATDRSDQFYRTRGREPGFGERALTAGTLPARQREIHRRLIELNTQLYDHLLSPPPPAKIPVRAAARAVGNRNRI